jgi:hypothetical protein
VTLEEILREMRMAGDLGLQGVIGTTTCERLISAAYEAGQADGPPGVPTDFVDLAKALRESFSCLRESTGAYHDDVQDCWNCWANQLLEEIGL